MRGGTLLVSRYTKLLPHFKSRLEALGFPDVHATSREKDSLNMLINELKPKYLIISSSFYSLGTSYMVGEIMKLFPDMYIAVINSSPYPDSVAAWFVFQGVQSYINLFDGIEEFHRGLKIILNGGTYIAPDVQRMIDGLDEWPNCNQKTTKRQREVLFMLCNGCSLEHIKNNMHISKRTVEYHIKQLYNIFHCHDKDELVKIAFYLEIVIKNDLIFNGRKFKSYKFPAWVEVQRKMNKEQRIMNKDNISNYI